jgi:T4 RnlA family RNA ligase
MKLTPSPALYAEYMNYNKHPFPLITNLNEVIPFILGKSEFVIKDCGDHYIVNYNVNFEDTFPPLYQAMPDYEKELAIMRRECRGIAFDKKTGEVIRRPPHKFFNLNEREETQLGNLHQDETIRFYEKLDGSMISAYKVNGRLIFGTQMGETDIAAMAHNFVSQNLNYGEFAAFAIQYGWCPTFEFCSRKNRVVVDYPEDRLVLTVMRQMNSGAYMPYDIMCSLAKDFDVEVVQEFEVEVKRCPIKAMLYHLANNEQIEGVIVHFEKSDMRLKIKTDWYRALHGTVTGIKFEKDALAIVMSNTLDDLKPFLTDDMCDKLQTYSDQVNEGFEIYVDNLLDEIVGDIDLPRKEFARLYGFRRDAFMYFEAHNMRYTTYEDLRPVLIEFAKKKVKDHLSSQTWVDKFRYLYMGASIQI